MERDEGVDGRRWTVWRRARGILPCLFFIRALARAVSRLFLILHRGRECFTLRPHSPATVTSRPLVPPPLYFSRKPPRYRAS